MNPGVSPLDAIVNLAITLRRVGGTVQRTLRVSRESLNDLEVLVLLYQFGPSHSISTGALLEQLHLTSGALTSRLDALEELGHIRRERGKRDRRVQMVGLTPSGIERLATARERLQSTDLEQLHKAMTELSAALTVEPLGPHAPAT
ncbi:MAG: MarR family transcriptional regulator [Micromonosporaceae bacterium]